MHWHRSRYTQLTFLYQGSEGMKRMTSLRSKKEIARHWARIRICICGHRKAIRTAGAEKEHSVLVAHDMRKSRIQTYLQHPKRIRDIPSKGRHYRIRT
jgi:hypothetical protein